MSARVTFAPLQPGREEDNRSRDQGALPAPILLLLLGKRPGCPSSFLSDLCWMVRKGSAALGSTWTCQTRPAPHHVIPALEPPTCTPWVSSWDFPERERMGRVARPPQGD